MLRFPAPDTSLIFPLLACLTHSYKSPKAKNSQMYASSPNLSSGPQAHISNFLLDSPLNFSQELDMFKTEFFIPLHSQFSKRNQQF